MFFAIVFTTHYLSQNFIYGENEPVELICRSFNEIASLISVLTRRFDKQYIRKPSRSCVV